MQGKADLLWLVRPAGSLEVEPAFLPDTTVSVQDLQWAVVDDLEKRVHLHTQWVSPLHSALQHGGALPIHAGVIMAQTGKALPFAGRCSKGMLLEVAPVSLEHLGFEAAPGTCNS